MIYEDLPNNSYFLNNSGVICLKIDNGNYLAYYDKWIYMCFTYNDCPIYGFYKILTTERAKQLINLQGEIKMAVLNKAELPENLAKGFQQVKADYIEHALEVCRYNQSETARRLGISRGNLRSKLKEYFGEKYIK